MRPCASACVRQPLGIIRSSMRKERKAEMRWPHFSAATQPQPAYLAIRLDLWLIHLFSIRTSNRILYSNYVLYAAFKPLAVRWKGLTTAISMRSASVRMADTGRNGEHFTSHRKRLE